MGRLIGCVAVMILVAGCGQPADCPGTDYGPVVHRAIRLVEPGAALNWADDSGVTIAAPAGTFTRSTTLELDIYDAPAPWVQSLGTQNGFAVGPQAVVLTLDPTAVDPNQGLTVTLPVPPGGGQPASVIAVGTGPGELLVLTPTTPAAPGQVSGLADGGQLAALSLYNAARCPFRITLFVATPQVVTDQAFQPALVRYPPGATSPAQPWPPVGPDDTMQGKRILLTVHGLQGSPQNFAPLASWVQDTFQVVENGQVRPYYDEVWGLSYDSTAGLELIGTAFAQLVAPQARLARSVDLWAHSMGNLVSRYALETEALGANRLTSAMVRNYVAIAGVHEGTPLRVLQPLIPALVPRLKADRSSFADLLTGTVPVPGDWPTCRPNAFLAALNAGLGPDRATARYYTLGGTNPNLQFPGFDTASVLTPLLNRENRGKNNDVRFDGLVPVYCSQALDGVLAAKSAFYAEHFATPGAVTGLFDLNHVQLVGIAGFSATPQALAPGDAAYPIYLQLRDLLGQWVASWIAADCLTVVDGGSSAP